MRGHEDVHHLGVHFRQHLAVVAVGALDAELVGGGAEFLFIQIAQGGHLDIGELGEGGVVHAVRHPSGPDQAQS